MVRPNPASLLGPNLDLMAAWNVVLGPHNIDGLSFHGISSSLNGYQALFLHIDEPERWRLGPLD